MHVVAANALRLAPLDLQAPVASMPPSGAFATMVCNAPTLLTRVRDVVALASNAARHQARPPLAPASSLVCLIRPHGETCAFLAVIQAKPVALAIAPMAAFAPIAVAKLMAMIAT